MEKKIDFVDTMVYDTVEGVTFVVHYGEKVTTFKERFSELFDESEQTTAELAARLHVSKQTLSAWRLGVRSPKEPTIIAIARYFNVDEMWLMGFNVEKEAKHPQSALPADIVPIKMAQIYRLPILGAVAAGEPVYEEEFYGVGVDSPVKADYALRIKGDSMEPLYLDGDIVFIRKIDAVREGTIAVVLVDNEVCLKRVYFVSNGVQLISENPRYPPMICTVPEHDNIRVMGIVVGYTRMYKEV